MGWQIAISPMLLGSEVWNTAEEEKVSPPALAEPCTASQLLFMCYCLI